MPDKKNDKSTWAIGGGLLIGIGVGFFFLPKSPMVILITSTMCRPFLHINETVTF